MTTPDIRHETEQAVLSAMMMDPAAAVGTVRKILSPEAFRHRPHQIIAKAFYEMSEAGEQIEPLALIHRLEAAGDLTRVGGRDYVSELIDAAPTAANVEYHAKLVREEFMRTRAIAEIEGALSQLKGRSGSTHDAMSSLLSRALEFAVESDTRGYREFTSAELDAVIDRLNHRKNVIQAGGVPGFPTGFRSIDRETDGFRPGEFIIVGGVPKSQKTGVCLNIQRNAAERGDITCIVSAEMNFDAYIERVIAATAGVPIKAMGRGDLVELEMIGLRKKASVLISRVIVDDEPFPEVGDVITRATELKARVPGLKLLVADYLQLVGNRLEGRRGDEEINGVCKALKGIAKRLEIPVIAPAQCNYKEIEARPNKRPEPRDLQGASGMAQTPDFLFLVYNASLYDRTASPTIELDCKLSRRTAPFTALLEYDPHTLHIQDKYQFATGAGWAA